MWKVINADELCHHGILGQKWGVRRFQNPDGSLTTAGRRRVYKKMKANQSIDNSVLTMDQSDRLREARSRYSEAAFLRVKALREHEHAVENRMTKKYGKPTTLTKHDQWAYDEKHSDEFDKDTQSKRKLDAATKELDREIDNYAKIGRSISREILGKYADKTIVDRDTGKNITIGERAVKDLIGFLP